MYKDKKIVDVLYKIYNKELKEYSEMLVCTEKQSEAIDKEDFEVLNILIQQRDSIINNINNLEEEIRPYKQVLIETYSLEESSWPANLLESKFKEYIPEDLSLLIENIYNTVKKIKSIDNNNRDNMLKKRDQLVTSMRKVKKGIKANNHYNKKVKVYSTFIDKKG